MTKEYRFILKIRPEKAVLSIGALKKVLPTHFSLSDGEDGLHLTIDSDKSFEHIEQDVNRELDRLYFTNALDIQAEHQPNAYTITIPFREWIYSTDLEKLISQTWTDELEFQLHLWRLAQQEENLRLKAILLYHIIEVAKPKFNKKYTNPSKPPEKLLECLLIRNWISHAGQDIKEDLQNYCDSLGIEHEMFDPRNHAHQKILNNKLDLLKSEAQRFIDQKIDRAN